MKILTIIISALTLFALTANAKLVKSTKTGGAWEDGASWVGGETPEKGDSVVIVGHIVLSKELSSSDETINTNAKLVKSTTTGGAWEDGNTWVGGKTPEKGDVVIIEGGALVISKDYSCLDKTIDNHAKLVKSTATGGAWEDGASWVGDKIPENGDSVLIDGNIYSSKEHSCIDLTINKNASLTVNSASLLAYNLVNNGKLNISSIAKLNLKEETDGVKYFKNSGEINNSGVIYFLSVYELKNIDSK